MMMRIAWRSLTTRPVRTGVLAAGFGFGIAVMAELLGVGYVMLEQTHAPALLGGGDVVVSGVFGSVPSARGSIAQVTSGGRTPIRAASSGRWIDFTRFRKRRPISHHGRSGCTSTDARRMDACDCT